MHSNQCYARTLTTVAFVIAATVAAETTGQPPSKTVEQLFQAEQLVPPPPIEAGDGKHPPYLFERFTEIDPADTLTALDHILETYPEPKEPSERDAYRRAMEHKFQVLFEYYPLVARHPEDFTAIVDKLFDARNPEDLRVFLLRKSAPDLEAPTTFGAYLQGHLDYGGDAYDERLLEILQLPRESIRVQSAAMEVLKARFDHDYTALIARDALAANEAKRGSIVHVSQLITDPDAFPLGQHTKTLMEQKNTLVGKAAGTLKAISRNDERDGALRQTAKDLLAYILENFPVPNRASLLASD